jgi:nicotinate-nucleotide pyrophosphorylase (carboxylating)
VHDRPLPRAAVLNSQLPADLQQQVERALAEDIGPRDLTAELIPPGKRGRARVITREAAIICGQAWVDASFKSVDDRIAVDWRIEEGQLAAPDQLLFEVHGPARGLLTAERTALNFLQLLSATATAANAYVRAVDGTGCRILDTRKTIPGLRTAQKYATRIGGAQNHRIGLFDAILIKENHIMAAGSIADAVDAAKRAAHKSPNRVTVEVEVESLDELRQAILAQADIALLDDFTQEMLREAVALNRAAALPLKLEASGGITLANVRGIAETGVDYVSIGSITKHIKAVDLSMRFEWA